MAGTGLIIIWRKIVSARWLWEEKNYLFCGNDDAAENAAIIYSLMGCCKASEANFREWFVYVLENIHEYDNDYSKDLAELLPQNWKLANSKKL